MPDLMPEVHQPPRRGHARRRHADDGERQRLECAPQEGRIDVATQRRLAPGRAGTPPASVRPRRRAAAADHRRRRTGCERRERLAMAAPDDLVRAAEHRRERRCRRADRSARGRSPTGAAATPAVGRARGTARRPPAPRQPGRRWARAVPPARDRRACTPPRAATGAGRGRRRAHDAPAMRRVRASGVAIPPRSPTRQASDARSRQA